MQDNRSPRVHPARPLSRIVTSWLLLTGLYLAVLGSMDPWDALAGGVLAAGLLVLFRRFVFHRPPRPGTARRILRFVPFAGAVLADTIRGTAQVALVVLHLRPMPLAGIVAVPLGDRTDTGVAVSALAITLSPGSVLVDVDWDERIAYLHALDASDPDGLRASYQDMYDRYQSKVFP